MRISLVTEAYNLAEGQSEASFRTALQTLQRLASRCADAEVLVVDPSPAGLARPIVEAAGAGFRHLEIPGLSYDGQKGRAVEEATGDIVVLLDGDCRPTAEDWLDRMLELFADPRVEAVTGHTFYDDPSILGKAMTVMDFGFVFQPVGTVVGCYTSNNVAFRRSTWLACPPPVSDLRCNCYAHAQALMRAGRQLVVQPAAIALHEMPRVRPERLRRGRDLVGACWVNPELSETEWLEPTEERVEQFLAANQALDEERLRDAPASLGITPEERPLVWDAINELRLIDREGVRAALEEGERRGWNALARAKRESLMAAAASCRLPDPAPAPPELRGYVICSTPRSGSNFLCSLLESTGQLGRPTEYFNAPFRRRRGIPDYPDDPHLQLAKVLELGVTPNGVYGVKLFTLQMAAIRETRWADVLPNLAFVHLERGDLLGQAISVVRALQTDQWRHHDPMVREPRYDPDGIMRALRDLAADHARWRFWFASNGIEPVVLRYEEVMADPQSAVDAVADLMAVASPPVRAEDATVRVQRDALSAEWRARFLKTHGALTEF